MFFIKHLPIRINKLLNTDFNIIFKKINIISKSEEFGR